MEKKVCEMFAGVGGFRCGLNKIKKIEDVRNEEKWKTVWFNQWEPLHKTNQWAYACYIKQFGSVLDKEEKDMTNMDISKVNKDIIPDHNLLVAGFPCQDYSVASTLSTSKGLEGKKGILWWEIREVLEVKKPTFVLLENVDRLLKSPAKQRGRDFGIILACFRDLGYTVEWRVINAAEYGFGQRRRRVFIFAYKDNTRYAKKIRKISLENHQKILLETGFFASCFPVKEGKKRIKGIELNDEIGKISESFQCIFENSGMLHEGKIYTMETTPHYCGTQITLGDLLEKEEVEESFFIPEEHLYYTDEEVISSDETEIELSAKQRKTWQYVKGGKKRRRKSGEYEYIYSEGSMPMVDEYDKPARTMLTSEGSFGRSTHIVRDRKTERIRFLTPAETERIQGFPTDWTKFALIQNEIKEVPTTVRRFLMGNALVVDLVIEMEAELSRIFENEG